MGGSGAAGGAHTEPVSDVTAERVLLRKVRVAMEEREELGMEVSTRPRTGPDTQPNVSRTVGESRGEGRNRRRAEVEGGEPEPRDTKDFPASRRQRQRLAQPVAIQTALQGVCPGHRVRAAPRGAGGTDFRWGLWKGVQQVGELLFWPEFPCGGGFQRVQRPGKAAGGALTER